MAFFSQSSSKEPQRSPGRTGMAPNQEREAYSHHRFRRFGTEVMCVQKDSKTALGCRLAAGVKRWAWLG